MEESQEKPRKDVLEIAEFLVKNNKSLKHIVLLYIDDDNQVHVCIQNGIPKSALSLLVHLFQKLALEFIFGKNVKETVGFGFGFDKVAEQ